MSRVDFSVTCPVPVPVVFDYVSDHRNVPEYFDGITSYEPVTEQTTGPGSRFDAVMRLGPSTMRSRIETTVWQRYERLEFTSISGVSNVITYAFEAVDERNSRIDVSVEFSLPGGLAGNALSKTLTPFVAAAAERTAAAIARNVVASGPSHTA
ncbi:SRPBCC family protein [Nocardia sp. NPDC003482]